MIQLAIVTNGDRQAGGSQSQSQRLSLSVRFGTVLAKRLILSQIPGGHFSIHNIISFK